MFWIAPVAVKRQTLCQQGQILCLRHIKCASAKYAYALLILGLLNGEHERPSVITRELNPRHEYI